MSNFNRLSRESTPAWLERLISEGAPADICANVQAVLKAEKMQILSGEAGHIIDITPLKNALLNAKLEGNFLSLPDGEVFPIGKRELIMNEIPSKLLVRDFHYELRLIIAELRQRRGKGKKGNGGAIFFGPSGIGKSWSSMSVLVDELRNSKNSVVYFDSPAKRAFVFGEHRNVQLEGCYNPNTKDIPELHNERTLLIYDAARGDNTLLPALGCEMFIFTSPIAGNIKGAADCGGLLRFVCPSWESTELIDLEHGYGNRLSKEEITNLINEMGGNPRAVVVNPEEVSLAKFTDDVWLMLRGGVALGITMSARNPSDWPSSLLKAVYTTREKARTPLEAFNKYIDSNVGWDYSCDRARDLVYQSYERITEVEKRLFGNWLKFAPKGENLYAYHFKFMVGELMEKLCQRNVEREEALSSNEELTSDQRDDSDAISKDADSDLTRGFSDIGEVERSTKTTLKNQMPELTKFSTMSQLPASFPVVDHFKPSNNCFSIGVGHHTTIKLDSALTLCATSLPSNKGINFIYDKMNRLQSLEKRTLQQFIGKLSVDKKNIVSWLVRFCMRFK